MRRLLLAVVVVFVATAALGQEPAPPEADPRFDVQVTEEMIRHSRIRDVLYFAGFAYSIGVLLIVLFTRISARLRDVASRVSARPFLMTAIYFALLNLVTTLFELPLSYYSGFAVPHQFNLSNLTLAAWLVEELKGLAIAIVITSLLAGLAILALRKVRRWWLALWLGSIPIMILLVVIAPVFLDPVFNKFEPLKDEVLRRELLDLASRAGIEGSRVYEVDKSKQTKTMNGYVTGLGPTKRIVMWDTLLEKLTHDEILAVMGHEIGHYVLHHLWRGLATAVVVALIVFFLAQRVYERGLTRWGERWGVSGKADPAALPWLMIIVASIIFFLSPVTATISRYHEHQADRYGLELTRLNEPMASAFVKFAEDTKINPDPHPFIEFWRYSHPSLRKRIDFVLHYRPWEARPKERLAAGE